MKNLVASAACLAFFSSPALSVPLAPGGVVFTTGTSFAADPTLFGGAINENFLSFNIDPVPATPFVGAAGAVQNRVLLEAASNTLTFAPRIRNTLNTEGGTLAIIAFRLEGFGKSALDVNFRTDGLGDKGFTSVSRSVDGDLMTFRYDDPLLIDAIVLGQQEESLFPSIRSDAVNFAYSGSMTIFAQMTAADVPTGDIFSVTIDGLAVPAPPVPIPASGLMLLSAFGALTVLNRHRRQ